MANAQDSSHVDITYKRPTLAVKLYDTTGEEDIDIIQILVDTGLAELCEEDEEEEFIAMEGKKRVWSLEL
jgi:hypothetical protein